MTLDRMPRGAGNGSGSDNVSLAISGKEPSTKPRSATAVFLFRRFRVVPRSRQMLLDDQPIELGSRAFDLLIALIEASGVIVTKEEIMKYVWPLTFVDESSLRFQMSTLRKVLGKDRDVIKTIPGRGYLFTVDVDFVTTD
jgi:DNA-binding winged helix-turn-helix (wHTH) protein